MKLRLADSLSDKNDPFKDDLLERRSIAEQLTVFLMNVDGPFTMALTGPYGSGKTHFIRRCKMLLENKGAPVVLINAWETDFASEPLAPIITELADKFSGKLKPKDRRWKKAKELTAKVAPASVPIGVKIVTAGILKAEDFTEAASLGGALEKIAEKQFEHFAASRKTIEHLKKELEQLAAKIRTEQQAGDEGGPGISPPVTVLIDELDQLSSQLRHRIAGSSQTLF